MKLINMSIGMTRKLGRHLHILVKYITISKTINILRAFKSYLLRETTLRSKPFILKVESSSFCNLRCLGCRDREIDFKEGNMPVQRYKDIIDELRGSLLEVVLYLWGEPFLNKSLTEMVSYATENKIGSVVSTNLHFMDQELADGLVKARLDKLIVCIDGVDQQIYERIRVGGNLKKVMENLQTVLKARKKNKSKYPLIEWQFVQTDFNGHQIKKAKEIAKRMGVDEFTVMEDLSARNFTEALKREKKKSRNIFEKRCPWLWFATNVQWDGKVYPCCHMARDIQYAVGEITDNATLVQNFNSKLYIESRERFSKNPPGNGSTVCYTCPYYNAQDTIK